jgi:hypothetical protein
MTFSSSFEMPQMAAPIEGMMIVEEQEVKPAATADELISQLVADFLHQSTVLTVPPNSLKH